MKLVYIENNRPVTDSLTVAETFEKNHADVLRDIRNILEQVDSMWGISNFSETPYIHPQNHQTYFKYLIAEQGFTLLVMGYTGSKAMKFKVDYINEFNRMRESLNKPQLPKNYKEALIALVGEVEKGERLELEIKERDEQLSLQAPKVALYDVAMNAKNNLTMERVSKTLGYGRNKLFAFLREQKILRVNNLPYKEFIDRGYFEVRQYTITHMTTGLENKEQTMITQRGMAYIHKQLVEHGKLPEGERAV